MSWPLNLAFFGIFGNTKQQLQNLSIFQTNFQHFICAPYWPRSASRRGTEQALAEQICVEIERSFVAFFLSIPLTCPLSSVPKMRPSAPVWPWTFDRIRFDSAMPHFGALILGSGLLGKRLRGLQERCFELPPRVGVTSHLQICQPKWPSHPCQWISTFWACRATS